MSDTNNWSEAYVAWKLFETVIACEGRDVKTMNRAQILDLFSDCASAVTGEYVADIEDLDEDIDDDLDEEDFDDDEDDEDDEDDD